MNTAIGLAALAVLVLICSAVIVAAPKNMFGRIHTVVYVGSVVVAVAGQFWMFVLVAMGYGLVAATITGMARRRIATS